MAYCTGYQSPHRHQPCHTPHEQIRARKARMVSEKNDNEDDGIRMDPIMPVWSRDDEGPFCLWPNQEQSFKAICMRRIGSSVDPVCTVTRIDPVMIPQASTKDSRRKWWYLCHVVRYPASHGRCKFAVIVDQASETDRRTMSPLTSRHSSKTRGRLNDGAGSYTNHVSCMQKSRVVLTSQLPRDYYLYEAFLAVKSPSSESR